METGCVIEAVESGQADIAGHHPEEPTKAMRRRLGSDELLVLIHRSLHRPASNSVDVEPAATVAPLMWPRELSPGYYDAMIDAQAESVASSHTS